MGHAENSNGLERVLSGHALSKRPQVHLRRCLVVHSLEGSLSTGCDLIQEMLCSTCEREFHSHFICERRSASCGYFLRLSCNFFRLDRCLPAAELSIHVAVWIRRGRSLEMLPSDVSISNVPNSKHNLPVLLVLSLHWRDRHQLDLSSPTTLRLQCFLNHHHLQVLGIPETEWLF